MSWEHSPRESPGYFVYVVYKQKCTSIPANCQFAIGKSNIAYISGALLFLINKKQRYKVPINLDFKKQIG